MSTSVPSWKAELIEKKKAAKWRMEQIPEWKRNLLDRIRTRHELVKETLFLNASKYTDDDCLVLNEHILKVSKNIFIRMELEQKLASPPLSPHKCYQENVQENNDHLPHEHATSGLVSRMKGRYFVPPRHRVADVTSPGAVEDHQDPSKFRSKSAVDPQNYMYDRSFVTSTKSPKSVSVSSRDQPTSQEQEPRVRKTSIDLITPRGFSPAPSHSVTSKLFQKVTSPLLIKKFSAPVSTRRKTPPAFEKLPEITPLPPAKENSISVTKVVFQPGKNNSNLQPKNRNNHFDDLDLVHETITLNLNSNLNLSNNSSQKSETKVSSASEVKPARRKPIPPKRKDHLGNTCTINRVSSPERDSGAAEQRLINIKSDSSPVKHSIAPVGDKIAESDFKKNNDVDSNTAKLDEILSDSFNKSDCAIAINISNASTQRTPKYTIDSKKSIPTGSLKHLTTAFDKKQQQLLESKMAENDSCNISSPRTMSGTNDPPPQLHTPNKTAELETRNKPRKNSPKNKVQENETKIKVQAIEAKNEIQTRDETLKADSFKKADSEDIPCENELPQSIRKNATLNTSEKNRTHYSVRTNNTNDTSPKSNTHINGRLVLNNVVGAVSKETVDSTVNAKAGAETTQATLDIVKEEVKTSETSQKPSQSNTSSSPARTKLSGPGVTSTRGFGGKTFMIDPSKFKKSSSNTTQNNLQLPSDNISGTSANQAAAKGKRKLRADQIIVVGGYVKLERSSLMKPNKMRRKVRVKFVETTLELIHHYPSENSLLKEEGEVGDSKFSKHSHLLPSRRDSELDNYTAKCLLAMKEDELNLSDDDDDI